MNKKVWIIIPVVIILSAAFLALKIKRIGPRPSGVGTKPACVFTVSGLLSQARGFQAKDDLINAKAMYQKLITEFPNSPDVMNWQKITEEINIKLLFSPIITSGSILYEIKPGDALNKIAREFKTTVDLIKKSNNLAKDLITPAKKIKVIHLPFSIFVDKSQNLLMLKFQEEILKTYIVSTGKDNSTPIGSFKIINKLIHPTWFKAGAVIPAGSEENVLGTRWLGFNLPGYGIHGTTEPQNLGKQVTQGCVRMANSDVEELYTIVPEGTEVIIVD
ncbi:MAG: L,D-transpeptidase family protein [Candidatus Omnitrophota bacterium]|nr:L,D-transpeptidase family protein [Candidatus Omnitrophota bacterium]